MCGDSIDLWISHCYTFKAAYFSVSLLSWYKYLRLGSQYTGDRKVVSRIYKYNSNAILSFHLGDLKVNVFSSNALALNSNVRYK